MKFSIVTLSFNQGKFLEQAICSVLEQDYLDLEYIVVDPGSSDGSRDIICKYEEQIHKIILEPDQGPADGLNKGFSYATGDLFGFLNADDYLLPGAISSVVDYFNTHPNFDVVSGHGVIVDEKGNQIRKLYTSRFGLMEYAYGFGSWVQPSTFFRSAVFWKVSGFNIANSTNWDGELFLDIKLNNGRFAIADRFLSAYRIHSASITGAANNNIHEKIRHYRDERFRKIMRRKITKLDRWIALVFLLLNSFKNPLNVLERIMHGPIYRRYYQRRVEK